MKNNKGITLIALVVTIIVLLILAGVSIAMLTGDNGILSNAQTTSTENAYYGAEEQAKLAFMSVKTRIMANTVKDGSYNATESSKVTELRNLVASDLKEAAGWTIGTATVGTKPVITMHYADSSIDKGKVGERTWTHTTNIASNGAFTTANVTPYNAPRNEGFVNYTITLYPQNASLELDCVESTFAAE